MTTYTIETYCPKCKNSWELDVHFPNDELRDIQIVETICEKCGSKQRFEAVRIMRKEFYAQRNSDPEIIFSE